MTGAPMTREAQVRTVLADAGIELRCPLPAPGGTVRTSGRGKPAANRSCAITVLVDRVLVHDFSSGFGAAVRDGAAAARLTPAERGQIQAAARREAERARTERAERHRRGTAAWRAHWDRATPVEEAPPVPYLVDKGETLPGTRVARRAVLMVPRFTVDGALVAGQWVGPERGPDGRFPKRYATGAPTRATFYPIGTLDPAGTAIVCEGPVTGATLHRETGHPVAAAMDAGNLLHVARALRTAHPRLELVIAGDDDRGTLGNPGRTAALAAAEAVGARVALPTFCNGCSCGASDFNDAARCVRLRGGA